MVECFPATQLWDDYGIVADLVVSVIASYLHLQLIDFVHSRLQMISLVLISTRCYRLTFFIK